jgi:hypothetical protein
VFQHFLINNYEVGCSENNNQHFWMDFGGLKFSTIVHLPVVSPKYTHEIQTPQ